MTVISEFMKIKHEGKRDLQDTTVIIVIKRHKTTENDAFVKTN